MSGLRREMRGYLDVDIFGRAHVRRDRGPGSVTGTIYYGRVPRRPHQTRSMASDLWIIVLHSLDREVYGASRREAIEMALVEMRRG
jgi:hypothetical protein